MDLRALVALTVKTAGLVLMIFTLSLFPARIGSYLVAAERSTALFLGLVFFPVAVPLVMGLVLFTFPATCVRAVTGVASIEGNDAEALLQSVVFGAIGLYVGLRGLLDLVYFGALHAFTRDMYAVAAFDDPSTRAELVASGVSVLVGAILLFGARG